MQAAIAEQVRQPGHDVHPMFVNRWSPRAFSPKPVPRAVLDSMAEAARWAPSSFNLQPWRFLIVDRPGPTRDAWNEAVNGFNRSWSDQAPVLAWVVARRTMGENPFGIPADATNRHHAFDTGAATLQLILEGERHGVRSHPMGGVDAAKARAVLGLADDEELLAALAIGYAADPASLPDGLRKRETPSQRKPLAAIASFA
jgi:nitroreductase